MIVWLVRGNMIKSIDQLYHWDSFLTQEEYNAVWEEFEYYNWTLSGFADKPEDDVQRKFWYKELSGAGYTRSLFKIKTEQFLNNKIITERLYGNGQAHSQSGWIHRDIEKDQRGEFGTLVYYLHKNWKPVYGGNIYFLDDSENITNTFFPKTNSAILFDSKVNHFSAEPTVYCTSQRISIAFKFKIKEASDAEEVLLDFSQIPERPPL